MIFWAFILLLQLAFGLPAKEDQNVISEQNEKESRLIQTAPNVQQWLSKEEIMQLKASRIPFMDITDYQQFESLLNSDNNVSPLPSVVSQKDHVFPLYENISIARMKSFLTRFSSFHNRYYESQTGLEAAHYLHELLTEAANESHLNVSVRYFNHRYLQPSIIVSIPGTESDETVIIGAHFDSINLYNEMRGRAPGADDDGSGTTSSLESLRILLKDENFKPKRTVEFHYYSAEELGLLGSQGVAYEYSRLKRKVYFMLQNDCTGYVKSQKTDAPHFGLIVDFVDKSSVEYLKVLIKTYASIGYLESKCGYGCSDHASWYKVGARSSFLFEGMMSEISPYFHTEQDTIEKIDLNHVKEFVKINIAAVIELAM